MAQTHDIEDVLSSIRRLVANEPGTIPAKAPTQEGPTLVLEAEHRVTEPEDPFQMIRTLAQEERDGRDAEHLTDALPDDLAAITGDLVDTSDDDAETVDGNQTVIWADDETALESPEPVAFVHTKSAAETEDMSANVDLPRDYAEDTDYEAEIPTEAASADGELDAGFTRVDEDTDDDRDALSDLSSALKGDEALRDLISEIVRQELSGELGERITRNVRKLVRREIRQMLASEEFD